MKSRACLSWRVVNGTLIASLGFSVLAGAQTRPLSITTSGMQTYGPTTVLGNAFLQGTELSMPSVTGDAALTTSFSASQTVNASGNLNLTTFGAGHRIGRR